MKHCFRGDAWVIFDTSDAERNVSRRLGKCTADASAEHPSMLPLRVQ